MRRCIEKNIYKIDCQNYIYHGTTIDKLSATILQSCEILTKKDFVIIFTGTNEKSSKNIINHLYYIVNNLQHTNVTVHSVPKNNHLNVSKLNREIRSLAALFKNHCRFIGLIVYDLINKYDILKSMSLTRTKIIDIIKHNYRKRCYTIEQEINTYETKSTYTQTPKTGFR